MASADLWRLICEQVRAGRSLAHFPNGFVILLVLMTVHFLSINDIPNEDLADLLDKADNFARGSLREDPLKDRTVAMLFEKPSLRTRVSFEMAIHQLGGHSIYLGRDEVGLDVREPVEDRGIRPAT